MSGTDNPEVRAEWLKFLSEQVVRTFYNGFEHEMYAQYGYYIQNFLQHYNLPPVKNGEYVSVQEGIGRSMVDYIKSAEDQRRACGAVLWAILNKVHPKEGKEVINFPKTPEGYRKYRRSQRKMMQFLGNLNLDLSAKDKINALDRLGYKYSAEEYRAVYKQLGNYSFGENPADFEYEKKQTVKIFHELHAECQKSTRKDKVISARSFLETVARNADVLRSANYNGKTIDEQSKADIYKVMKNLKGEFAADSIAYYSGNPRPIENVGAYLSIVLNKYNETKLPMHKKSMISRDFLRITSQLEKQENIDAKTVDAYSSYLSLYASWHHDNDTLNASLLAKMLEREAHRKNEATKAQVLFPDYVAAKELPTINKNLVLKVAQNYANSFSCSNPELQEFNPVFHNAMTEMFANITTRHNYRKSEVQALCNVLGSNGDAATRKMGKQIMSAYTSKTTMRPYRSR